MVCTYLENIWENLNSNYLHDRYNLKENISFEGSIWL